jgi:putative hemolysin
MKTENPAKHSTGKKLGDARKVASRLKGELSSLFRLGKNKIHRFNPKVSIHFEKGPFILKTVSKRRELIAALKLRYDVFFKEFKGAKAAVGVDVDAYDRICDHLVIVERESGKIVGTYRLNSSLYSQKFYSAEEFQMQAFLKHPATKLEMGRACVHKDFRRGIVMALLWRGIAEYMQKTQTQFLFGCGSVKTEKPDEAALLLVYFEKTNRVSHEFQCEPTSRYHMPGLAEQAAQIRGQWTPELQQRAESLVPALFKSYLKAGAQICGTPAYDRDFHCIDFLVIMDKEHLNDTHSKKYGLE